MIKINSILEVTDTVTMAGDEKRKRWVLQDIHILSGGSLIFIGRRINKKGEIIQRMNQTAFNYIIDGKMMWDVKEIN